jgi:hypothetical protein
MNGKGDYSSRAAPARKIEDDTHPWRGLFVLRQPQKVLFTQALEFRTAELPRWNPHIVISRRPQDA